jgi:flagellar motor switch protein FliM
VASVKPWDIRQTGQVGREHLRAINLVHEGFARNLTQSLGAYLGVAFKAALVSVEHLPYREFLQRVPEVTYLASCKLLPMGRTGVLQLDLAIVFPIIDLLLGGEGKSASLVREITDIEEQIIESVVRIVFRELQASWRAQGVEFVFERSQPLAQAERIMLAEEKTLSLSFEIILPDSRGTLNLAVPVVVSNALLRKPRGPAESRERIRNHLLDSPFQFDFEVRNIRLPMSQLAALAAGDILMLSRRADALGTLRAGEVEMFSARVVRRGDMRAAQLLAHVAPLPDQRKD